MENRKQVLELVLERSPYFEYLCRCLESIGFCFPSGCELVLFAGKQKSPLVDLLGLSSIGIVDINTLYSRDEANPDVWIELDEEELLNLASSEVPLSKMKITINKGHFIYPQVENILKRIFIPPLEFPLSDRIEIIYWSMFDCIEPRIVWRSEQSDLLILKYENAFDGLDVYITSGLTNPENSTPSLIEFENGKTSGYGYELMITAKPNESVFRDELVSWTKYIEETKNHIYPGQFIEYREGRLPNTDLSGFIITPPIDLPEIIPVSSGYGRINLLLGVTAEELEIAKKEDDIYIIADKMFEKGYVNYSPTRRNSVM
ncbi:suppressor of fused domain protein [Paenibacillus sp. FSL L8-0435]|uniref:suppressor of fused domain protein n=1 Tax=Paenibacillus TaxID=44249 RepID=UPI001C8EBF40|nr:suppressor of fused domain protein [Paenibacillus xylanexedens]MBY0117390.1 suppressor of fused domain protein [Paenibacillus xylanexedens]